jgi:hypothetical protein
MIVFDTLKKFWDLIDCGLMAGRLRRHARSMISVGEACPKAVLSIHKMATRF